VQSVFWVKLAPFQGAALFEGPTTVWSWRVWVV